MDRRPLGQTSLSVSRLSLGTMTFGGQVDEPTAASMVDLCLERGVNFIDTANVYEAGASEAILGRILERRRDHFILATKVGLKMGPGADESGLSRAAILKAIDDSLRRLKSDYVDIFYLHLPDRSIPLEESLETLECLVRAGKIRQPGASNFAAWEVCRMRSLAEKNGWHPVEVVQPMYNLIARGPEQEFLPMARFFRLGVVPYNPLAGGLLSGKHRSEAIPAGTRFEKMPAYRDRYWHDQNFSAIGRLTEIAAEAGRSLIGLSYGWLLSQSDVSSVLVGASTMAQLRQNIDTAEDAPLTSGTLAACDEVWRDLRGVTPTYNR